jgi:hypothetical protein
MRVNGGSLGPRETLSWHMTLRDALRSQKWRLGTSHLIANLTAVAGCAAINGLYAHTHTHTHTIIQARYSAEVVDCPVSSIHLFVSLRPSPLSIAVSLRILWMCRCFSALDIALTAQFMQTCDVQQDMQDDQSSCFRSAANPEAAVHYRMHRGMLCTVAPD